MDKIKFNKKKPWGVVPEALITDLRLSHGACRLAVWLVTRPNNWDVWRSHAMASVGLGIDGWQAARRQLEDAGYLKVLGQGREKGRFKGLTLEFDPQPPNPAVPQKSTVAGKTVHGRTGDGATVDGPTVDGRAPPLPRTLEQKQKPPPPPPQQQQQPCEQVEVVGVVDEIENAIHWPALLDRSHIPTCIGHLKSIDAGRAQELVDELAGRLCLTKIMNPAGYLRALVLKDIEGGLVLELARDQQQIRHAKKVYEERVLQTCSENLAREIQPKAEPFLVSQAGVEALKAARELLSKLKHPSNSHGPRQSI